MKNFKLISVLLLVNIVALSFSEAKAQSAEVNFSVFQNDLSPFGRWYNNPRFGQVWVYGDPAFKPYATDGHWQYTNFGWSWVSDYNWGWAPFHYGRWEYDPSFGWMWIPGYEWASAWVSWSQYNDYYGWAPLGYGADINISFGAVPYDRWNFIPRQYMGSRDFYRHCSSPGNNFFRNAVIINNYYTGREGRFTSGPERREVEQYTNRQIEEKHIDYPARNGNTNSGYSRGNVFNNSRDKNNNAQGRVYDNRNHPENTPINSAPQNNPVLNHREDNNIPDRSQNNLPSNTQNQPGNNNSHSRRDFDRQQTQPVQPQSNWPRRVEQNEPVNNNNPLQTDNNFDRPQQQQNRQHQSVEQEVRRPVRVYQGQEGNMEQRQLPVIEQRRIEREPGSNNNGRTQENRVQNNQPPQSQARQEVRRPGRT
ncbi:MAG: hypothetical protein H7320_12355 [Ferruginibacter sp.]|nr:hypothetical protein [Ferruginibacter sp.]